MRNRIFIVFPLLLLFCTLSYGQNLVAVEDDNGKYGFKREGEVGWVVKPKYDQVGKFSEGLCSVAKCYGTWRDRKTGEHLGKKWQYGYIDETGKECIPLKFEWAGDFHDGRAAYMQYDREFWIHFRYGYIDVSGDPVIPPNFSRADDFKDGYASVSWFDEDLNFYSAVIDIYGTYYDYETY